MRQIAISATRISVACALVLALTGCSATRENFSYWFSEDGRAVKADEAVEAPRGSGLEYRPDSRDHAYKYEAQAQSDDRYRDPLQQGFSPSQTHKRLNDYAAQLAMDLMANATRMSTSDLVGIASFVRLNRSLQEPTVLGNQMAEYLMAELQDFGLAVVDYKLANGIQVTESGDLSLSRKGSELANQVAMDHILTGTLIEDGRGVRVNARIVSVENRQLVASASVYIPAFMVTSLNAVTQAGR
ncbi:hypothetical protein DXV75_13060 [Alteromonas aestuariivivens]|uniref:FlgO domain-containing protein n=1 Tax=Alteromonas aestuariivivens TaxID=1938339 RepID=A0A3D8M4T4_9ALTE|nr:FlgO family outer membrane protein [Alteromonas aestuariivivens]RDV24618.1 hypothetical protein DXV75_13060 [Alteromonas aestuariivivens]